MDDDELILLLLADNKAGQEEFNATYHGRIHAIAMDICQDDDDANDITNIVILKVFQEIGSFHKDCELLTWVHRITTNVSKDYVKHRDCPKYKSFRFLYDEAGGMVNEPCDTHTPENNYDNKQIGKAIANAIKQLKDGDQKDIFILKFIKDLSISEMVEKTGKTPSSVKSLLNKGTEKIQKILRDYYDEFIK